MSARFPPVASLVVDIINTCTHYKHTLCSCAINVCTGRDVVMSARSPPVASLVVACVPPCLLCCSSSSSKDSTSELVMWHVFCV